MKLDREEKEILKAYETGQLKPAKPSKKELDAIKAAAESTFKMQNVELKMQNGEDKRNL